MKILIYSLGLLFLFGCQNNVVKQEKQQAEETNPNPIPTHYVTCSKAHVRSEPNPEATSKGLLTENQQVTYQKESSFNEIIAIKGRQQPENWYFINYQTADGKTESGWIYGGCLAKLPDTHWQPNIDRNVYLVNRHLLRADCPFNVEKCEVDCACDCCTDDLYFLADGHVIMETYCCCDNPIVYLIGTYQSNQDNFYCSFDGQCVLDSTGIEGVLPNAVPVYDEVPPFDFAFSPLTCGNGLFMMQEKKDKTVAIFAKEPGVAEYVASLKKQKIYEMLYKLLDQK